MNRLKAELRATWGEPHQVQGFHEIQPTLVAIRIAYTSLQAICSIWSKLKLVRPSLLM
jgi:hypothetical protein